jgi:hypothetical protein
VDPAGYGKPMRLEGFSLAATDAAFWLACSKPGMLAKAKAATFLEYLRRALTHLAPLTRPADLAWLLASYARDAPARVEAVAKLPALATLRTGLEQALGLKFDAQKGEHFFRSTLVQTLFYGIFSAWVPRTEAGIDGPIRLACRRRVTACPHGWQSIRTGGGTEFPADAIRQAGYHAVWRGEKRWNGVAILSRWAPVVTRMSLLGDASDGQCRYLEAAINGVLVASIYAPNGTLQPGPKFDYKLAWLKRLNAHAAELCATGAPVVLAGDYNVVPRGRRSASIG